MFAPRPARAPKGLAATLAVAEVLFTAPAPRSPRRPAPRVSVR